MRTKSLQSQKISNTCFSHEGKKVTKQRSDPVQYQQTHITSFWIFLNLLSSSQNKINIRISKIYTTSVINVIVTFVQSTLSKKTSVHTQALCTCTGAKIFKAILELITDRISVPRVFGKEDKYPTCTYQTTLTTQTTVIRKLSSSLKPSEQLLGVMYTRLYV